jgi:hypothetical protein
LDVAELEGGGGQKAHIDRAANPHRSANHLAGFRLNHRTIFAPVDEKRSYQRSQEREDDSYADA